MVVSGLGCGKALVGTEWATLHKWAYKTVFWPCRASISASEALFSLCRGDHWPRAMTIESGLESGCGLSHESVQDGCNGTCVKLEASKPT